MNRLLCAVMLPLACGFPIAVWSSDGQKTVADTLSNAQAPDGRFISWREHRIDDEGVNGGEPIRGGDGLVLADIDRDGRMDVISVHEDSHHLRIAFGGSTWHNISVARGRVVGAIEDVAVGDVNGDGWPDIVAACEEAHLAYFQNPGASARNAPWPSLVPEVTTGRGSWIRVALADMNGDGRLEVLGANKGFADVVRSDDGGLPNLPTSLFWLDGDPLDQVSWREQVLMRDGIPNHVLPVDVDGDGDVDVLAASRVDQRMMLIENQGMADGELHVQVHPLNASAAFPVAEGWRGVSNAFDGAFTRIGGDARMDLLVNVLEFQPGHAGWVHAGLGWLQNPGDLSKPWGYRRIGHTLPDWVIGVDVADIDGDGYMDAVTGGYSGLNVVRGGYSGASRDIDDPSVTAASSTGRIAWFQNPGAADGEWRRHDISRRVRGMYDAFVFHDMDADGDLDMVATRGNSGAYDGVFWLEQVRTDAPESAFRPARAVESRPLPLPPEEWRSHYETTVRYIAPNKEAQEKALRRPD